MELGNDATYHVREIGSISFQMPSGDVLKARSHFVGSSFDEEPPFSFLYDI